MLIVWERDLESAGRPRIQLAVRSDHDPKGWDDTLGRLPAQLRKDDTADEDRLLCLVRRAQEGRCQGAAGGFHTV